MLENQSEVEGARKAKLLQGVYTALENHNYSRAIKLCTSNKTISDWAITKALKAHALERLDGFQNKDEVKKVLLQILPGWTSLDEKYEKTNDGKGGHGITDEATLSAIAVTLRAYKFHGAVVRLYNEAVAACQLAVSSVEKSINRKHLIHDYHSALKALIQSHIRRLTTVPHRFLFDLQLSDGDYGSKAFIREDCAYSNTTSHNIEIDWMFLRLTRGRANNSYLDLFGQQQQNYEQTKIVVTYYEDLQTTAMQLARTVNLPDNATLYWSWAVWSILLHYQAVMILHEKHQTLIKDDPELYSSIRLKIQMLPKLAESLCRTKVVQPGNVSISPSGEDWKLYIRTLLTRCSLSGNGEFTQCDQLIEILSILNDKIQSGSVDSIEAKHNRNMIRDEMDVRQANGSILPMSARDRTELLILIHRYLCENMPKEDTNNSQQFFKSIDSIQFFKDLLVFEQQQENDNMGCVQWTSFVGFIRASFSQNRNENCLQKNMIACKAFLENSLVESVNRNGRLSKSRKINRGAGLALLEFDAIQLRKIINLSQIPGGSTLEYAIKMRSSIERYLMSYYSKDGSSMTPPPSCTYRDLRPYLVLLVKSWCVGENNHIFEQEVKLWTEFLCDLSRLYHPLSPSYQGAKLRFYTVLCQLSIETSFLLHPYMGNFSCSENEFKISNMVSVWLASLKGSKHNDSGPAYEGRTKEELKEGLPGDDLLILIAHALMREAIKLNKGMHDKQSKSMYGQNLIAAAALLEKCLQASPFNARVKIALVRVCSMLNAGTRLANLCMEENIFKHVQHESLSYLTMQGYLRAGMYRDLTKQCMDILKLHRSCSSDTPPFVMDSLQNGNLSAATDMLHFQATRMNLSCQSLEAKANLMDMAPLVSVQGRQMKLGSDKVDLQDPVSQRKASQIVQQPYVNNLSEKHIIGSLHGIIGIRSTDNERIRQMVEDAYEPHSAPSIFHQLSTIISSDMIGSTSWPLNLSETSDNRDFEVLDYDLVSHPDFMYSKSFNPKQALNNTNSFDAYVCLAVPLSQQEMINSSMESAYLHGLLLHAALLFKTFSTDSAHHEVVSGKAKGDGRAGSSSQRKKRHSNKKSGCSGSVSDKKSSSLPTSKIPGIIASDFDSFVMRCQSYQETLNLANGFRIRSNSPSHNVNPLYESLQILWTINMDLAQALNLLITMISPQMETNTGATKVRARCLTIDQVKITTENIWNHLNSATGQSQALCGQINKNCPSMMYISTESCIVDPLTLGIVGTLIPRRLISLLALTRFIKVLLDVFYYEGNRNSEEIQDQTPNSFICFCKSMEDLAILLMEKISVGLETKIMSENIADWDDLKLSLKELLFEPNSNESLTVYDDLLENTILMVQKSHSSSCDVLTASLGDISSSFSLCASK